MKKYVFSILLVVLFFTFLSIAVCKNKTIKMQYDDYVWGMKKNEVIDLLHDKNFNNVKERKENYSTILKLSDTFFGEDVLLELKFTDITNKLYKVSITFDNRKICKKIETKLRKKYGEPVYISDASKNLLAWTNEKHRIWLDYVELQGNEPKLDYVSIRLYNKKKEEEKLLKKEDENKL